MLNNQKVAYFLDFANHHPESTKADIETLCASVLKYGFHSAFVNPCWVRLAKILVNKKASVGTVVSFPLGQDNTEAKIAACCELAKKGVDELDISTNVGWLKEGKSELYFKELKRITQKVKEKRSAIIVKFIIETGLLTNDEIKQASLLVLKSKADFVKTCSGMGPRGARISDVKIIKQVVGDKIKIKVAGGIHNFKQVKEFLAAGVNRIGTSKAIEIVTALSK